MNANALIVLLATMGLAAGCRAPEAAAPRHHASVAESPSPAAHGAVPPAPIRAATTVHAAPAGKSISGAVAFEPRQAALLAFGPATISQIDVQTVDAVPGSVLLFVAPAGATSLPRDAAPAGKFDGRLEEPVVVAAGMALWIQSLESYRGTCTWSGIR